MRLTKDQEKYVAEARQGLKAIHRKRIQKLVEALTSGKFKQGRAGLFYPDTNTYCCLGVACKISKLAQFKAKSYMGETGILPKKVQEWYGFNSKDPFLIFRGNAYTATRLNDGFSYSTTPLKKQSFGTIARAFKRTFLI